VRLRDQHALSAHDGDFSLVRSAIIIQRAAEIPTDSE
jgi:hypothetical protein